MQVATRKEGGELLLSHYMGEQPQNQQAPDNSSSIKEIFAFKKALLEILSKFGKAHTQQKAAEELKKLMTTDITDNERMTTFLNSLTEINEHMSLPQMKE